MTEEAYEARRAAKLLAGVHAGDRYSTYATRKGKYWVYLIGNKNLNWFKIGISKWPEQRLQQFNVFPFEVELFTAIAVGTDKDLKKAMRIEKDLHKMYEINKIRGEWFHTVDVVAFVKMVERINK